MTCVSELSAVMTKTFKGAMCCTFITDSSKAQAVKVRKVTCTFLFFVLIQVRVLSCTAFDAG